jgi:tetratricopeptide (TPR) repeat protein
MHRFDLAIEQLRKTIEMDPNFPPAHFALAMCYIRTGRYDEALAETEKAHAAFGVDTVPVRVQLGRIYILSGRRDEALKVLAELEEESRRRRVSPIAFWVLYLWLGDKDRAFQFLERAFEERDPGLPLALLTVSGEVSSDPRLVDLRRRVGLP